MKHLRCVSVQPARGQTITPESKLAFIEAVLTIFIPVFTHKDPQNPASTTTTGTTTT